MSNPTSPRGGLTHLGALAGYAALTLLFVWPLPTRLADHITGDPAGDAGAYVWNAYVFSRNLAAGSSVLHTDRILSFASEASLALHNNSLLLSAFAAPLIPTLGVIGSFNAALVLVLILNPFCAYLLAWRETRAWAPSVLAGFIFGFSPFISARVEGHMSLATAFGLPLLLLATRTAMVGGKGFQWSLVGVALAVCAASDPYYVVFGVMAVAVLWGFERATVRPRPRADRPVLLGVCLVLALSAGSALAWILATGGGLLSLGPIQLSVRSAHTPVLGVTLAFLLLLALRHPRTVVLEPGTLRSLKFPALAGLVAGILLFPWLQVAAAEVIARGGTSAPPWRSSPPGVDLLSFFVPNPTHPLVRAFVEPLMTLERADAFVEGVASLTLAALLALAVLIAFRGASASKVWVVFTCVFAALALGPFVLVGGQSTYVPGPWALLRFVPGIGMVRSPSRFAVLAALGFAIVLAQALVTARLGRWRSGACLVIATLVGAESFGPPRRLFPAALPERYQVVATDRCDVVIVRLPTGIKDGTRQRGRFSSETQFRQVFHGKRLLGGYVSRLSDETVATYEEHPTIRALLDLSEGRTLSPEARRDAIREAAELSRQIGIGFLAVNKAEASQDLRDFVQEAFKPRAIYKAWPFAISVPFGDDCAKGECGHRPGCSHRQFRGPD